MYKQNHSIFTTATKEYCKNSIKTAAFIITKEKYPLKLKNLYLEFINFHTFILRPLETLIFSRALIFFISKPFIKVLDFVFIEGNQQDSKE